MKDYYKDYSFEEWENLSKEKQIDIINNYWDPFNPTIGQKTKSSIIDNFLNNYDNKDIRQVGIKNFGFYAVQLFVITDKSDIKTKTEFGGLKINKGIVKKHIKENQYQVKWRDGGTDNVDLTERVIIR